MALDVLVVGAGQSGLATGFALRRAKVENILLVDAAARGMEGPWRSYARMRTLRSPKEYTGPDLDVPSLTYRAWHEARFGVESWERLGLIGREHWADYLLWVREVTGVPVENGARVVDVFGAGGGLLGAAVEGAGGRRVVYARKVVLATGQDGAGCWWMPAFVRALPEGLRAHAQTRSIWGRCGARRWRCWGWGRRRWTMRRRRWRRGRRRCGCFAGGRSRSWCSRIGG